MWKCLFLWPQIYEFNSCKIVNCVKRRTLKNSRGKKFVWCKPFDWNVWNCGTKFVCLLVIDSTKKRRKWWIKTLIGVRLCKINHKWRFVEDHLNTWGQCYKTFLSVVRKLQRKLSFVNAVSDAVCATFHFLCNLWINSIS